MYKFTKVGMGLILIETESFSDARGSFSELYKVSEFNNQGITDSFVQESLSRSKKGVLRGLHFQMKPAAQGKLVTALEGKIFDVAVDIRKNSPTLGKWYSVELSKDNNRSLWIPEGFAHGFLALEDSCVLYKLTKEYSKEAERGILWNDPNIGIEWPVENPAVNERDGKFGKLKETDTGFSYL